MRITRIFLAFVIGVTCVTGFYVINWYQNFYSGELNLATAESVNLDGSVEYYLDGDDYEIDRSYGLSVTGDRNQIMRYHKTAWWGIKLKSGEELMVCVRDKQHAALEAGTPVTLHGTVTAVPEVLEHHPDPDAITYCLTCPDDGSDLQFSFTVTMCMLGAALIFLNILLVKAYRKDSME